MKISIVMPVYNAGKHLEESINSVIEQTCADWELIMVNDGSTDSSAEICNRYAKKYSDRIFTFHKENEGQFMTRLFGIKKCSGDYIGFLDADDVIEKDFVAELKEQIINHNNPDIVCFSFCNWNGEKKETVPTPLSGMFDTAEKLRIVYKQIADGKLSGSLCSKLFKAELLKNFCLDADFVKAKRYGEDAYHSFSVLFTAESVMFIDKMFYCYRANPDGASQGFDKRNLDYFNTVYVFEAISNGLSRNGISDPEIKKILSARNFNETVYFILKYYRATSDRKRRNEIVKYNWSEYLLDDAAEIIKDNKYIRKNYIKVWNAFEKKKYFTISFREKFKRIIGW